MTLSSPRVHVAIAVRDLDRSVAFYSQLFGLEPAKKRLGYAKFELAEPRLNFTLNETPKAAPAAQPAHYGIEVPTPGHVATFAARLEREGLQMRPENDVTCCYAKMDKFWVYDPDGHAWEVFAITEADVDSPPPVPRDVQEATEESSDCCPPTCCT